MKAPKDYANAINYEVTPIYNRKIFRNAIRNEAKRRKIKASKFLHKYWKTRNKAG